MKKKNVTIIQHSHNNNKKMLPTTYQRAQADDSCEYAAARVPKDSYII